MDRPSAVAEWARCRRWIEAALKHDGGFYRIEDIEALIGAGEAHFWAGERSAAVTQFWYFPRSKAMNLWLAGGNLRELRDDMFPAAQRWAIERDCTAIMLAGRRGWERVFAPLGFKPLSTVLLKELIL